MWSNGARGARTQIGGQQMTKDKQPFYVSVCSIGDSNRENSTTPQKGQLADHSNKTGHVGRMNNQ